MKNFDLSWPNIEYQIPPRNENLVKMFNLHVNASEDESNNKRTCYSKGKIMQIKIKYKRTSPKIQ